METLKQMGMKRTDILLIMTGKEMTEEKESSGTENKTNDELKEKKKGILSENFEI